MCKHLQDILDRVVITEISSYIPTTATSAKNQKRGRYIVGEVRGKEALELLNSYNTGHDGGMSSGHGNSPKDMLARLETMVLMGAELPLAAIRSQIASALDVMIHLGRERNKKRRVFWIMEVDGYEEGQIRLHTLYELGEQGLEKKGELKNTRKLWMAGEEI